jgi:hypothetical protein
MHAFLTMLRIMSSGIATGVFVETLIGRVSRGSRKEQLALRVGKSGQFKIAYAQGRVHRATIPLRVKFGLSPLRSGNDSWPVARHAYSHSIVPGGFDVTS